MYGFDYIIRPMFVVSL